MTPKKILVVEDEPRQQLGLQRILREAGLGAVGANDLRGARDAVAAENPDIILLDLHLSDGSGIELLQDVKEAARGGDVIVLTGMEDLSIAVQAMQCGAYDFLAKPVDRQMILEVVTRCLRDQAARGGSSDAAHDGRKRPEARLVGTDPQMLEVFKLMGMAATGRSPVLIRGGSGTGKELVARSIHQHQMADRPFVAVNCAALPDGTLESELFGHVRGAFTGAATSRKGNLESAGDGTLLLDEIGDTSPSFQTKLLRVLQEREFTPLGSDSARPLRARVMAATHRPLEEMIEAGQFRADLYFRLRVIEIIIPPLAQRRNDIPRIARHLLSVASQRLEKPVDRIPDDVMELLVERSWPGNVRELENAITRAVALARGTAVTREGLGLTSDSNGFHPRDGTHEVARRVGDGAPESEENLDAVIAAHVRTVLGRAEGNKREAARRLGISPARLYRILSDTDSD